MFYKNACNYNLWKNGDRYFSVFAALDKVSPYQKSQHGLRYSEIGANSFPQPAVSPTCRFVNPLK
jgi:hypothetical protein